MIMQVQVQVQAAPGTRIRQGEIGMGIGEGWVREEV